MEQAFRMEKGAQGLEEGRVEEDLEERTEPQWHGMPTKSVALWPCG